MPITRRCAAAAAVAAPVPIDISSDSDAGSESGSPSSSEEEDCTSDEDYVDISDTDSEAGVEEEAGAAGSEEEPEPESEPEAEQPGGVDRSEAACVKIADLLRRGRNLDGIKLMECKAYLKKNGLSQTGDMATCVERIMLHWRFKYGNPEKIYPRLSFCINCKGDVCRSDAVLFKQKVYEKSAKKHSKCIGKRIVAGKVIKESYGKEKQQHTFTIQVFWSKGVSKLPPLHLLLVKGRNLYRMMTFRQPWPNEADRLKTLEEKHNRGDAARRVRALNRPNASGKILKGKKSMEKGKHQSHSGWPEGGSSIPKGKKRVMQSSNLDPLIKRSRKEEHQASSGNNFTGDQRAKLNRARMDKNHCTSSSSLCNDNREKNHVTLQRNCHIVPVNNFPCSTQVQMGIRNADSQQKLTIGGSHVQREHYANSYSHMQASRGNLVGIQQPFFEKPQRPPPFREVGNSWQPHIDGRSAPCPNPTMGFNHPNAALASWHAPAYYRGITPNQPGVVFPSFNVPQTIYHPRPEGAYPMPQFRYSGGSNGFPR